MSISVNWSPLFGKKNDDVFRKKLLFKLQINLLSSAVKPQISVIGSVIFPFHIIIAFIVPKAEGDAGGAFCLGLIVYKFPGNKIFVPGCTLFVFCPQTSFF